MTDIDRVRVVWTGFLGSPGVSTFYFADASLGVPDLHVFFADVLAGLAADVHLQIEPSGDTILAETGALVGAWTATPQTSQVGADSGNYHPAAGIQARWETGVIHEGHRVVGRTFLVPMGKDAYTDAGAVNPSVAAAITAAGNDLIAASSANMRVWSRPRAHRPAYTDSHGRSHPDLAAHDGTAIAPSACVVPTKPVVLTSRRD